MPDMTNIDHPVRVAAFYCFTAMQDCVAERGELLPLCSDAGIRGTVILAPEGINGTLAGSDEAIESLLGHIRALPGCGDIAVKELRAETMPFHRLKIRIKREIVTMGEPGIDPAHNAGEYVSAEDWNALIADPDTILIDTRNDYEVTAGTFDGAIDPATPSFSDFPAWFRDNRGTLLGGDGRKKVAMFCTGGIRCEKATALLKREGVDEVYHLEGGILKYLETVAPEDSRWQGECFVFDERVTVTHGLETGSYVLCRACRMPLNAELQASPLYEKGVSCPLCHDSRGEAQRAGYAERQRQMELANKRGENHIGRVMAKRA